MEPIPTTGLRSGTRRATRTQLTIPLLHYNQSQADFYGGNFWDGRATGYKLQNSAAEQAQDPPGDTRRNGQSRFRLRGVEALAEQLQVLL